MKNKKILILFGLFVIAKAYAQSEWIYLGEAYENAEAYLDKKSIQPIDDQNKQFKGRLLYTKKGNESVTEIEAVLQCNNRVVELNSLRFYPNLEASGKPTKVEQYEIPVFFPLGQSQGDQNTYRLVCSSDNLIDL